jgi:hypothetical protein
MQMLSDHVLLGKPRGPPQIRLKRRATRRLSTIYARDLTQSQLDRTDKEHVMTKRIRRGTLVAIITAGLLSVSAPAFGDAPPPTNGGNGAGSSGQCTGNPADRPASCH